MTEEYLKEVLVKSKEVSKAKNKIELRLAQIYDQICKITKIDCWFTAIESEDLFEILNGDFIYCFWDSRFPTNLSDFDFRDGRKRYSLSEGIPKKWLYSDFRKEFKEQWEKYIEVNKKTLRSRQIEILQKLSKNEREILGFYS